MKAAMTFRARSLATLAAGAVIAATALVAGCSSDAPKPTPLEPLVAKITGHEVWKLTLASFSPLSSLTGNVGFGPQGVAAAGNNFVIGALNGALVSVDAATGKENWRADAGGRLSTGVGSDGRFTAVVTRDGDLVTLDGGKISWRQHLDSPVVTAPFVAGERVFVLGVDRSVQAFDALDGKKLWVYARPGDALTLSQAGVLTAWQDTLLFGLGARLTALDPLNGTSQPTRAARTKWSAWPTWSGRPRAWAACTASARSRTASVASTPNASPRCGRSTWTAARRSAPMRTTCSRPTAATA
jgi:outer membrane protein assembly factor BamB